MREIKFRVWIKPKATLLHRIIGFVIDSNKKKFRYYRLDESQPDGIGTRVLDLKDIELDQFTGLEDKNGKDIYEGDILKLGDTCSFIVWGLSGWRFNSYMERGLSNLYRYVDTTNGKEIAEIIGNIHENSELLK